MRSDQWRARSVNEKPSTLEELLVQVHDSSVKHGLDQEKIESCPPLRCVYYFLCDHRQTGGLFCYAAFTLDPEPYVVGSQCSQGSDLRQFDSVDDAMAEVALFAKMVTP